MLIFHLNKHLPFSSHCGDDDAIVVDGTRDSIAMIPVATSHTMWACMLSNVLGEYYKLTVFTHQPYPATTFNTDPLYRPEFIIFVCVTRASARACMREYDLLSFLFFFIPSLSLTLFVTSTCSFQLI